MELGDRPAVAVVDDGRLGGNTLQQARQSRRAPGQVEDGARQSGQGGAEKYGSEEGGEHQPTQPVASRQTHRLAGHAPQASWPAHSTLALGRLAF